MTVCICINLVRVTDGSRLGNAVQISTRKSRHSWHSVWKSVVYKYYNGWCLLQLLYNNNYLTNHIEMSLMLEMSWVVKMWLFAAVIVVLAVVEQEPCVWLITLGISWRNRWAIPAAVLFTLSLSKVRLKYRASCIVLMCVLVFRWSRWISISMT